MSVHEISDQFVDDYAAAEPVLATYLGVVGYDDQLTDYSPEGHAARAAIQRRALNEMEGANPTDDSERVAKAVFLERISNEYAIHDAGLDIASLNTIASPVQELREVFDMMPTDTPEQWGDDRHPDVQVPAALDGCGPRCWRRPRRAGFPRCDRSPRSPNRPTTGRG